HLVSGNATDVAERLDKGLLDFGVMVEPVDLTKFNRLPLPTRDVWGLVMRKDSPLAGKEAIRVDDLVGVPLLCSRRVVSRLPDSNEFLAWFGDKVDQLSIVGTFTLIYNASILVRQGVGYALSFDKLVDIGPESDLTFRPLYPEITTGVSVVWKRYQVFSPIAKVFLRHLETRFPTKPV
ncbi:MAG: LysR family transcriptional regulator substrate-binding protein, partial [Planctomycetes bacterium]|nr:LysR family transcriptional regulator substrate-binding protein [Planctomycetota bacterium]